MPNSHNSQIWLSIQMKHLFFFCCISSSSIWFKRSNFIHDTWRREKQKKNSQQQNQNIYTRTEIETTTAHITYNLTFSGSLTVLPIYFQNHGSVCALSLSLSHTHNGRTFTQWTAARGMLGRTKPIDSRQIRFFFYCFEFCVCLHVNVNSTSEMTKIFVVSKKRTKEKKNAAIVQCTDICKSLERRHV